MAEDSKTTGNEKSLKSGKGRIQVTLLDDTVVAFQVEPRAKGEILYQKVNGHLKVEESDYFGLQYYDTEGNMCWLDPQKAINKQVKEALKVTFKFRVMFYTPDPNALQEYTRYLFTLQVRRDLLDGRLHCSEDTGALLASYIVQGELGDFDEKIHQDGYLSGFQFVPHQSPEIEEKIIEYHVTHRGKSPAEADRCMLEVARQLEVYGITLYPAKDRDDADLSLSVYHMGILVFQNHKKINMFSWAKIRKLSFKKKKFMIKLHPKVYTADLVEFVMQSRNACKGFWKICIAHHVFFRQKQAIPNKMKPSLFSRGSKFRYSGRTQKQLMEDCRDAFKPNTADLERNRASRIQRGHDISSELTMLPTTPPPSYSSFKFDSPIENNQSTSSVKNSTDASEDEGSFTIGLTKSPPAHTRNSDEITNLHDDTGLSEPSNAGGKNGKIFQINGEVCDNDNKSATAMDEPHEQRLRSESDLEIEREVHSIIDQIKKETSWQYHLTTTEFDDNTLLENNKPVDHHQVNAICEEDDHSNVDSGLADGSLNHVKADPVHLTDRVNLNSDNTKEKAEIESLAVETNGDLNSNQIDNIMKNNNDLQHIDNDEAHGIYLTEGEKYDSDSGASTKSSTSSNEKAKGGMSDEEDFDEDIRRCLSEDALNDSEELSSICPESVPFYMAWDILMTERTFIKDLEILTVSFREMVSTEEAMSHSLMTSFFGNIDPLYDFHCSFLAELEDRCSYWKEAMNDRKDENVHKIGDIMLANMRNLKLYIGHINMHGRIMMDFQKEIRRSEKLNTACKQFELNKICYLPLNTLLLKPTQRLFYYKFILSRMLKELSSDDVNYSDIKAAHEEINAVCISVSDVAKDLENLHKLIELDRDLIGIEGLVHPKRDFIREGCLFKICKKEPQQRLFFLFSDVLLYTAQGLNAGNQFRVRSQIPLKKLKIKNGGIELHGLHSFTIEYNDGKSFVVAATTADDQSNWTEDIKTAVSKATDRRICKAFCGQHENNEVCSICNNDESLNDAAPPPMKIKNSLMKDYDSDVENSESHLEGASTLDQRHVHVRTLSTRRVCWHRNTSLSMNDCRSSAKNNISGDLFRKCKNQSKWQRLWVVFTNFTLFFFKSYEDDEPLASLPLIGYDIAKPNDNDKIDEEFCFKLHFKTHVYFFRAENEYTFHRWMESLTSLNKNSSRARIFSRLTSE